MGKVKAIGLLSGGLDSTLACKVIMEQGIEVIAINFYTGFCIFEQRRKVLKKNREEKCLSNPAVKATSFLGVELIPVDISNEYIKMVTNPKHGYGSNINPCIDCRIFMLKEARERMQDLGAKFIFTGEVLGQRPMTQHKPTLDLIAKEAEVADVLLRPLSAKVLPLTKVEEEGLVDREKLYGFQGRTRKPQMELADKFNLKDYPQPAGSCCFLTDETYARRFRDLFEYKEDDAKDLSFDDVMFLRVGRHFRLSPGLKIIVGRNEEENEYIESYKDRFLLCRVIDYTGPTTLVQGDVSNEQLNLVAEITARYSDGWSQDKIDVKFEGKGGDQVLAVTPLKKTNEVKWMI